MKLKHLGLCCPICGIKKGRQFNHAKCSKILQNQYNARSKAKKVMRPSDADYLAKL